MVSAERQIEFLSNLQRLLAEGSFVSTYKYALLLSLADLCVEMGRDDDLPLDIPTRRIGEKFAEYYWRQSAPYLPVDGAESGVLRQNTGEPVRIIKLLNDVRGAYEGSLVNLRRDERVYNRTVTRIAAQVRKMPLWKLQTVGNQKLDFLYGSGGGSTIITLKPGIGFCFRKHYSLVVDLVKGAWAQYVRRYNSDRLAEKADLHEFLFGSERGSLALVRPILEHFQSGLCFYCRRPMREDAGHVDHFVPWSRYPVDLGHNFVLAHAACNERKSDRLPAATHLNTWVEHNQNLGRDKSREFERQGVIHDLTTSVRIIDWAYRQTSAFNGLTWLRAKEFEPLPVDWQNSLASLLN
jgi:5-methylcytosine-specific restriction endonuclease McrA